MKGIQRYERRIAMILVFMVVFGSVFYGDVSAADPVVLDQKQENVTGNVWVNYENGRYQTFTPGITGNLSRIELNIFDTYGSPGVLKLKIYKEGNLSVLLGEAQLASYSTGWTSVDFSGASPYLQKDTMYRMVASTEFGGSSGFGWYSSSGNPYTRGYSPANNYDFSFRTYMIADYSTSPALSEISSAESSLVADGTSQTTVTVKLKDAQGNALTAGGSTVGITSTSGTVSPVTDNHNGTYTATLTAPAAAGTATVSATVGGAALTGTATVQFVAGSPSMATSTIEVGAVSLTADGTSQTTVTVKLKDAQGNALTAGGSTVGITSTSGTVSPVTDNHNGTYTATLTAPAAAGTATVSATVGGAALTGTATVQFVAGLPSMATSTVQVGDASLTADGTSQTTVTVKLKDAQGNALTAGGSTVTVAATQGTVSPVTDNHNGTYTATLTAPAAAGTATVSATVGGAALTGTATVQFVAGLPSMATSTVEVGDASLTADGTSQTTVTVKLKDAQGNALTAGGSTVGITSTSGTVSPVTDNHNGTYTATLTAPAAAGTATVSATVGGAALTGTATVQFVAGLPSMATSTIEVGDASLTADGTSQTTVTVKLKDAQGNALTAGGSTVTVASTSGTVSPVTDNHNGTYTATLTAPAAAGTATVSATIGGAALTGTATVQFVAGAPSMATSTIEVGDVSLTADGTSQTTVTVKLKDAQGNALTAGGSTVGITSTSGTVSPVTDNHNGTYTAMLTAPAAVGMATVSATVGGAALTSTATVQFVAGLPSMATSTIEVGDVSLTADGTSQTTVTVKLKDAQGNALTAGGSTVTVAATQGTVSPVTDNHNGTYTATLTAPATAGTATVSATVGGAALTSTATVQFVAGSPSMATSTIEVGDASLTADGTSQTTVTVKLQDAQGNALTAGGSTVTVAATQGTVSPVTDNHNGTYTATLTAPAAAGTAKISATIDGSALASTVTVQLLPGEVSSSYSTVTASDLVVRADGKSQASIYVRLKDKYDHPLAGKRVQLQAQDGSSVTQEVYGVTNEEGLATFAVSNVMAEKVTYSAKEEASGISLDETVSITFTYDQPPVIKLQVDTAAPTFSSVHVAVYASVYGEYNSISSIKWAAGSRSISYFDTQGTQIKDHFTVQENGIYSVYAADTAGNANVSLIEIQNIVPLSSDSDLTGWQLIGLGGTVKFDFDAGKLSNTLEVSDSVYGLKMLLTPANVYAAVYVNGLQVDSNALTKEYVLATGQNKFEVRVQAQDSSFKTYTLNVIRSAASKVPDSGSVPGGPAIVPGSSSPSLPGNAPVVWINNRKVTGLATRNVNANGAKTIDVLLNMDNLYQALDSLSNTAEANLSISVEEEADQLALRLTGNTVPILAGRTAAITIKTQYGQYRLPLVEIINQQTTWTDDVEVQIIIERGKRETELQEAATTNGFHLATDPVHFNVLVTGNGKKKEVTRFNHYVERVIYLSENAGAASTAIIWDQNSGVRPVPTEFTIVDGHQAAVIRSLTNSTYVVVSITSPLTDIKGHWAEPEISQMSNRMIVQGTEGGHFAPGAAITRAELAAMVARALGLPEGDNSGFRDVNGLSWYSSAVAAVKAYGIMDGFGDGAFRPNQKVSRQEAIVTIIRALRLADAAPAGNVGVQVDLSLYTDSSQIGAWAKEALRTAIYEGLMKGYGDELRPQQAVTRAETTVLLHRLLLQAGLING